MSDDHSYLPDWTPAEANDAFAVRVKKGIEGTPFTRKIARGKRRELSVDDYVNGVIANDKTILARAITLIESNAPDHYEKAREVLKGIQPRSGGALRVGITGVPGAGKSTLIEDLGCFLIDRGHRVAVLAVDPSSSVTRGSILGDKTRMEKLSRKPGCFIRPSPSGGTLGGVTRKSRETVMICEAAGYDVILIETVGVGQSEVTVRSMVDFFLLLLISGGGDELQGIKKGVMELADAVFINKADGGNKQRAELARGEYAMALKYLAPATPGWETRAFTCSALTGEGVPELWNVVQRFREITRGSGEFERRRQQQSMAWVFSMVEDYLKDSFYQDPQVRAALPDIEKNILDGSMLPTTAAEDLLKLHFKH